MNLNLFENLNELLNDINHWDETKENLPLNPSHWVYNGNVLMKLAPGEGR